MGNLTVAYVLPRVATGSFGVLFGAEDNTTGTAYTTSDASGFAHVGYSEVVSGATNGTGNRGVMVAPSQRIMNLVPNDVLTQISIRRGRTRLDQYDDVGECTITVLNTTGDFDPDNNNSRYQRLTTPSSGTSTPATATYASWIQPGMFTQVLWGGANGTQIPLFTGILETAEPSDDRVSTATYTFVDRIAQLGRTTTVNGSSVGANGDTGNQRLNAICQIARLRDVYNGNGGNNLIEQVLNIIGFSHRVRLGSLGDTALDCIKTIVNGEAGRVFANRSGVVNVWDRATMAGTAAVIVGTFTDTPSVAAGFGYDEIQTNQAQNFLYNSAVVTVGSAISATATLDESIAQYGQRQLETECCLSDAGDTAALATFLATEWATPTTAVASVSLQAYAFSQNDFDVLAKIDLQQGVRVYRKLPGNRTLDVNCVVEGIEIDISPSTRRFTFYLSPRDTTSITWPT